MRSPPAPTVGKGAIKEEFWEASTRAGAYRMREEMAMWRKVGKF